MKSSFDDLESGGKTPFADINLQFRVLIFTENETAESEATRLYKHLTRRIPIGCRLEIFSWDTKGLKDLDGITEAVTVAEMILIAGTGRSEFPAEIKSALEMGLSLRRVKRGALVALLARTDVLDPSQSALHASLRQTAQKAGLDYFPGVFDIKKAAPAWVAKSVRRNAERKILTFLGNPHRFGAPVGYGLNE